MSAQCVLDTQKRVDGRDLTRCARSAEVGIPAPYPMARRFSHRGETRRLWSPPWHQRG